MYHRDNELMRSLQSSRENLGRFRAALEETCRITTRYSGLNSAKTLFPIILEASDQAVSRSGVHLFLIVSVCFAFLQPPFLRFRGIVGGVLRCAMLTNGPGHVVLRNSSAKYV